MLLGHEVSLMKCRGFVGGLSISKELSFSQRSSRTIQERISQNTATKNMNCMTIQKDGNANEFLIGMNNSRNENELKPFSRSDNINERLHGDLNMSKAITIFGIYVVDMNFRSERIPIAGETLMGHFSMGPGGKGSNQAIAASRAGGRVNFIAKIGADLYGDMALEHYKNEGVHTDLIIRDENQPTGIASIMLEESTGRNAIVVCPAAASTFTVEEIMQVELHIRNSAYFMTQLEMPLDATFKALELASEHQVPVILNPAPAHELPDSIYPLCDFLTPNEVEASSLSGISVKTVADAEKAADFFLERGVKNVIITFGEHGVVLKNASLFKHVPAIILQDPVIDTTGAGDAFNGSFVTALSQGMELMEAIRYANTAAGISVTRYGTAPSTAYQHEIEQALSQLKDHL